MWLMYHPVVNPAVFTYFLLCVCVCVSVCVHMFTRAGQLVASSYGGAGWWWHQDLIPGETGGERHCSGAFSLIQSLFETLFFSCLVRICTSTFLFVTERIYYSTHPSDYEGSSSRVNLLMSVWKLVQKELKMFQATNLCVSVVICVAKHRYTSVCNLV